MGMASPIERFCEHTLTEPRKRIRSNGAEVVVLQCLKCGAEKGGIKKAGYDMALLPAFDEQLLEDGNRDSQAYYNALAERRRAEYDRQREQEHFQRTAAYQDYMRSEQWQWVKRRALLRDNFRCQHCGAEVNANNSNAHHIMPWGYETYRNFGYTMLYEVVTLCVRCHAAAHGNLPR